MCPAPSLISPSNLLTLFFHSLSQRVGASFAQATPQRASQLSSEQETQGATESQVARSLQGTPENEDGSGGPRKAVPKQPLSEAAPTSPASTVPSSASKLNDDVV